MRKRLATPDGVNLAGDMAVSPICILWFEWKYSVCVCKAAKQACAGVLSGLWCRDACFVFIFGWETCVWEAFRCLGLKNIAEEITMHRRRLPKKNALKEKPRLLEALAEAASEVGRSSIWWWNNTIVSRGQLVNVNLDFESDSDDEDSSYSLQSIGIQPFSCFWNFVN